LDVHSSQRYRNGVESVEPWLANAAVYREPLWPAKLESIQSQPLFRKLCPSVRSSAELALEGNEKNAWLESAAESAAVLRFEKIKLQELEMYGTVNMLNVVRFRSRQQFPLSRIIFPAIIVAPF
jgi:hypothetical protein